MVGSTIVLTTERYVATELSDRPLTGSEMYVSSIEDRRLELSRAEEGSNVAAHLSHSAWACSRVSSASHDLYGLIRLPVTRSVPM